MCHFISGVLTRFDVLYSDKSDSHTDILEEHGIDDPALIPEFVEFELVPPNGGDWANPRVRQLHYRFMEEMGKKDNFTLEKEDIDKIFSEFGFKNENPKR
jgi:hypothetical protein